MAICTSVVTLSGQLVVSPVAGDPSACAGPVLLSSAEYINFLSLLTSFGWDSALFDKAWQGGLVIFSIGLSVGLIISLVRKIRP